MKTALLTLVAVVGLGQLSSGGIGRAGFDGTFTTDSLYHGNPGGSKAPVLARVGAPGRTKIKATANASRGHRPPAAHLSADR